MLVQIRKWELADAPALADALSNKAVQVNLRDGIPYPYTVQDARKYIAAMRAADENETFAYAVTVDAQVVGSIAAFRQANIHSHTAELGYYLSEAFWGRGVMTEAVRQLCAVLFAHTDILRVYAEPFAHNVGSRRVLEKAGFQYEGTLRRHARKSGRLLDMTLYALVKEE